MARGARALATSRSPVATRPRVARAVAAHAVAGTAAGVLVGVGGWLLLTPVRVGTGRWGSVLVLAAVTGAAVLRDLGRLDQGRTNQVPSHWLARHGATGAYTRYGLILGATYGTHVPYSAAWVLLVAAGLQPSVLVAAGAVGAMAAVRSLAPLGACRSRRLGAALSAGLDHKRSLRTVSAAASVALLAGFVLPGPSA